MEATYKGPVNAKQIKEGTGRDPMTAKVRHCILIQVLQSCCHFFSRKDELSVEDGCILWGCSVVFPPLQKPEEVMKV